MIRYLIISIISCTLTQAIIYDSYTGEVATPEEIAALEEANILETCTNDIEPCNESDWRRIDGSCNNPKYPSAGCFHTPQYWLVKPEFGENFGPRLTKSGKPFKPARYVTKRLLESGKASDDYFTQLASLYMEFIFSDFGSAHDIANYLTQTTYCCEERGKTDYMCTPNYIPEYDPVHRFSGLKCLNLTRQLSFQNIGCTSNNTRPDRIDYTTPYFDLSSMYNVKDSNISNIRADKGGELKTEIINGGEFPSDGNSSCLIKDALKTGCTRHVPNGILGTNIETLLYWRYHNFVASYLAKINPCWSNDLIFYTAREITIAVYVQILYYGFLPHLLGRESLLQRGVISNDLGHRDPYDSSIKPQIAVELAYTLRYSHITQDGDLKMYNENGTFVKETPVVNYTLAVEKLTIDDTLLLFMHGITKQNAGRFDDRVVDSLMSEVGLGPLQYAFDILTADLSKGRWSGVAGYTKYRDFCVNYTKNHTKFEDLFPIISLERLQQLKEVYEDVEDVEYLAGLWMEGLMEGARVPPTVHCVLIHQFKHIMAIDSNWYERPNRPHAFTLDQLLEIRKATISRLLCDVGDKVTRIQRDAFILISPENEVVNCSEIPSLNLTLWKDYSCDTNNTTKDTNSSCTSV